VNGFKISENRRQYQRQSAMIATLVALFFLFGPIVPFLFRYSDGVGLISFSLLPFGLLSYYQFLKKPSQKTRVTLITLLSLILLVDISIFSTLFLGMVAVFLATTGWKKIEKKIKSSILITIYSLLITTFWYGPTYWWRILFSPSFAGKPLFSVIGQIGQLLPIALAVTLAAISGKFFKPKQKKLRTNNYQLITISKFAFFWLFIFGFLTLMRFIADPDFWLDWMSYGTELQLGLAIALALLLGKLGRLGALGAWLFLFSFTFNKHVLGSIQKDITKTVEYRIGEALVEEIKKHPGNGKHLPGEALFQGSLLEGGSEAKGSTSERKHPGGGAIAKASLPRGETKTESSTPGEGSSRISPTPGVSGGTPGVNAKVFLSGTTAFWLNAFFDIPQVRGGNDGPSAHPDWRAAAWEIRDGSTGSPQGAQKSVEWLKKLGVSYLVVHTSASEEFWHDFKHPEKFEDAEGLEKVYDQEGDRIYRLN
jgi:hypothetical protein